MARITALALALFTGCDRADSRNFSLAGIDRPRQARHFLEELRDAAEAGDLQALAGRVRYPFRLYDKGEVIREYATLSDLIPDLRAVFTPGVLTAIREQDFDTLFVNYQGVMIGGGAVWFDAVDGAIRIKAVHP